MILKIIRKHKIVVLLVILGMLFLLLPVTRFNVPYSTVITASDGTMLGARIASDGQWRFPQKDTLPDKFKKCIIGFEDRRFYYHPGIDLFSAARAVLQNFRSRKVVSGASTLPMQVVRLSRKGKRRTTGEKLTEMVLAVRLCSAKSKNEILSLYAAHAPFGGNVVGLDAAAWRYFGCPAEQLSWGESAGLAVLPNAPSRILPGRNTVQLKKKRDNLLHTLLSNHTIDSLTFELAVSEPLPGKPGQLPDLAHHLLNKYAKTGSNTIVKTTIDRGLQLAAQRIIDQQMPLLKGNQIYNAACVVAEIKTGKILAYVGNADWQDPHGGAVDMIEARRSTGSILKPFLYAAMLDDAKILPHSLVPDLPLYFAGYAPQNFDRQFRGAVPASEALIRSLNIPAVFMLKSYTPFRFLEILRRAGLSTFTRDADHYGLSLILGGGESTLRELVSAYGSMARVLNRFNEQGVYHSDDYFLISERPSQRSQGVPDGRFIFRAAPVWQTFDALTELNRPEEESGWQQLSSAGRLAWKTGTSFGFRDAWAIGVNPEYVIGVWVGNANGEGRPGLTGGTAAAPVLFGISSLLNASHWFEKPLSGMLPVEVCRESGFRASVNCDKTDTLMVPASCINSPSCPYHVGIHLDASRQYLVNASCYPQHRIVNENWFVLPPAMEHFYRKFHPGYRAIPSWLPTAQQATDVQMVELIYPDDRLMVYLPRDYQAEKGLVIFQAAHRRPGATLFWHLDNDFLGRTRDIHQMAASPLPGNHRILIVDEHGNSSSRHFKVVK